MSKLASFESYADSPYMLEGIVPKRIKVGNKDVLLADKGTGEYLGEAKVPKYGERWHDGKVYVKVFTHHIPELTMELSPPASKMLWYIIFNLPVGVNWIDIKIRPFLSYSGYGDKSVAVYYRAVTELLKSGIIARKAGDEMAYWINTNFMFNGDRTKFYKPNDDQGTKADVWHHGQDDSRARQDVEKQDRLTDGEGSVCRQGDS